MPRFSNIEIEEILARASKLVVQFISDRVPPPAPLAPAVSTNFGTIIVDVSMSVLVPDLSGFTVYRNTTDDVGTAVKVGGMLATTEKTGTFTDNTVVYGTTYYYWARAVDWAGNIGAVSPTSAPIVGARTISGSIIDDGSITLSSIETLGFNKVLRTDSAGFTLDGNQLPDYAEIVTTSSTQTLKGKTIDGDENTLKDVGYTSLKVVAGNANKVVRCDSAGATVAGNQLPDYAEILTTSATQTFTGKTTDLLSFDVTGPDTTPEEGDVFWDTDAKTLAAKLDGPDVTLQIGQEHHIRATNKTGSDITNGQVVYVNGAQGSRPTIALAKADADATSHAIGVTTEDIDDNGTGYVTTMGLVRDVDTSAWTAGTTVYLSAATAGALTSTAPSFSNYVIKIGCVLYQDATNGIILVHPGIEPSNHVMLNHLGAKDAQIGDISGGDYSEFESDGTLKFVGDATVWDDSQVPAFEARTAAASLTLANLVGGLYNPRFDINDEIFGSIQLSHRMKTSGTVIIKPHIHLINQNAIGATNYLVKFEFEWAWGNISSTTLSTTTNDPQTFSFINESALTHKLFSFSDITAGSGQGGISSYFLFRLKRVAEGSANAYNTNDIFHAGFDLHFEIDTAGSREPASK